MGKSWYIYGKLLHLRAPHLYLRTPIQCIKLAIRFGAHKPPLGSLLLLAGITMTTEQKSRSTVRYLAQWPYVELSVAGRTDRIRPTIPKETIVKQVLDTEPLFKVAEPTD